MRKGSGVPQRILEYSRYPANLLSSFISKYSGKQEQSQARKSKIQNLIAEIERLSASGKGFPASGTCARFKSGRFARDNCESALEDKKA